MDDICEKETAHHCQKNIKFKGSSELPVNQITGLREYEKNPKDLSDSPFNLAFLVLGSKNFRRDLLSNDHFSIRINHSPLNFIIEAFCSYLDLILW